jgi:hypothetical protein
VKVTYQGCADAGLCYPPITKTLSVSLEGAPTAVAAGSSPTAGGYVSEQDSYADKIKNGNLALVLLSFFGAGLLLAFTPCVLPMVPILSGIIAGSGDNVSTRRSFLLSVITCTRHGLHLHRCRHCGGRHQPVSTCRPVQSAVDHRDITCSSGARGLMLGIFTIEMPFIRRGSPAKQ